MGLEPMISRTTIWRANQLHHTHHITYRTVFCPTKYHHIKFSGLNEPGGIRTLDLRLRRPLLYPAELQTHFNIPFSKGSPYFYGKAGDGNRTHVSSLEGWCSTIELHPHSVSGWQDSNLRPPGPKPGALAKLSHTPMYHLLMVFIKLLSSSFVFRFRFLPDDKWYYIIAIYKCQHLFWIFLKKLFFTFFPPI